MGDAPFKIQRAVKKYSGKSTHRRENQVHDGRRRRTHIRDSGRNFIRRVVYESIDMFYLDSGKCEGCN